MTIQATPAPTFLYPRFKYGATPVTVDITEGALLHTPSAVGQRGANAVASGKIEYLFSRIEEAAQLELVLEPEQYQALRWMFEDALASGTAIELWVDRYTGSAWLFEQSLRDQNGLALVLNTGTASYVAATNGFGLSLGASQSLSVATAQASAATRTGYDDPLSKTEGVLWLDVKPTWAATDGAEHYFLDTTGTTANRLRLYKTTGNVLRFEILDASAGSKIISGSPSWSANARVEIVASWASAGVLSLWYAVNGGAMTALTTSSGAGTGIIGTLGATLYVGSTNAAGSFAPGIYDSLVFHARAWSNPQNTPLRGYRPPWRNYLGYAELTAAQWQPARVAPARLLWRATLLFRNGVA